MDFSEFTRRLGAEPRSGDPELRRARESSPEFEQAAREALAFEELLERALNVPLPEDLVDSLAEIAEKQGPAPPARRIPWGLALAASVLLAVGAAGISWQMNRGWDSVEEYVVDHYHTDGPALEARLKSAAPPGIDSIEALFAEFGVEATPELADVIGVIKYCPTPDGKGVHMVLNTRSGPLTVIYMPGTRVKDRETLDFDGRKAVLVDLPKGSAAIIGPVDQSLDAYYAKVHDSIVPLSASS